MMFVLPTHGLASLTYLTNQHVIMGMDEEPLFGQIELFVCMPSSNDWCIVVSCLQTVDFSAHYHSHRVNYPKVHKVVTFDGLVDFHVVCCYRKVLANSTQYFVRLPHHVVQTH